MGVPTSEVGCTAAMPRREDHEDMWWHWGRERERKKNLETTYVTQFDNYIHDSR
jgi:hypothetical protein